MSSTVRQRIAWVDYGKGLAILLVFLGHSICPEPLRNVIYGFHIPVFYFLSGYVFSVRKYPSFGPFVWNKVRTLIIPGLAFGFLAEAIKWLHGVIAGTGSSVSIAKMLIGVVVEVRGGAYGPLPWFFGSLFLVELASYWLFRMTKQRLSWLLTLALVASLVGYGYGTFIGKIVPWGAETSCTGFGFFMLGYAAKRASQPWFDAVTRPVLLPLWLAVTLAGTWLNVHVAHERLDVYLNHYGWYPFTMMAALGGIAFMLGLLRLLELRSQRSVAAARFGALLEYTGRNSLILYSLNKAMLLLSEGVLAAMGASVATEAWAGQLLWGVLAVAIGAALCTPFIGLTNRCFPALLGRPSTRPAGRKLLSSGRKPAHKR